MEENRELIIERKKRTDFAWGVIIAAIFGFTLNLLANLYYDLFIVKAISWDKVDHMQVLAAGMLLLGLLAFLQFIIDDYKNNIVINKSFVRRYLNYFFYKFVPGKILRYLIGSYILLIFFAFVFVIFVSIFITLGKIYNYYISTLIFLFAFLFYRISGRIKRRWLEKKSNI